MIRAGDVIADGPSTELGEIALGKNVLVAFMTWEGYNFEDAILINEKLVVDDSLTSVHIEEHESEARDTKLGPEEITPDIPNVSDDMRKYLDEHGVIMVGAEVKANDILVGKVTPKGKPNSPPKNACCVPFSVKRHGRCGIRRCACRTANPVLSSMSNAIRGKTATK